MKCKLTSREFAEKGGRGCPVCGEKMRILPVGRFDIMTGYHHKVFCANCESSWKPLYAATGYERAEGRWGSTLEIPPDKGLSDVDKAFSEGAQAMHEAMCDRHSRVFEFLLDELRDAFSIKTIRNWLKRKLTWQRGDVCQACGGERWLTPLSFDEAGVPCPRCNPDGKPGETSKLTKGKAT